MFTCYQTLLSELHINILHEKLIQSVPIVSSCCWHICYCSSINSIMLSASATNMLSAIVLIYNLGEYS